MCPATRTITGSITASYGSPTWTKVDLQIIVFPLFLLYRPLVIMAAPLSDARRCARNAARPVSIGPLGLSWFKSKWSGMHTMNTKMLIRSLGLIAGFLIAQLAMAQTQAPAGAPAGATGLCKDGTYYTGATKQGACKGHQGVKDWYAAPATSGKAATSSTTAAPASTTTPATTSKPAAGTPTAATTTGTKSTAATSSASKTSSMAEAPGGGAGKVWVNTASNVYHCPGSKYYGKTKAGAYMSEADAKAKGAHPDHGQACSK